MIAAPLLFDGVTGVTRPVCVIGIGAGLAFCLIVTWPLELPTNKDAGIVECCIPSSSGSTNSNSLSAALSACSARALKASSTTGWLWPARSGMESDDKAFDIPIGFELLDLGEIDCNGELDFALEVESSVIGG